MSTPLVCIVCQTTLENIDPNGNQPDDGLAFHTSGHYGSTVFDPMDGTFLEINVCDPCLVAAGEAGAVMHGFNSYRVVNAIYSRWSPPSRTEGGE